MFNLSVDVSADDYYNEIGKHKISNIYEYNFCYKKYTSAAR